MTEAPYRPGAVPVSAAPHPPLTRRARRGAWIAGVVSFCALTVGWSLLMVAIMGAFLGLIMFVIAGALRADGDGSFGRTFVADVLDAFDIQTWAPLLILAGLVGIAVMVLALFASRWILGGHGVARPWGVTWAATGIAIVASWIIGGILGTVLQVLPLAFSGTDLASAVAVAAGVGSVGGIILTAAIGFFTWWWMAHVFRPRDAG